jgi:hypothetical protein
MPKIRLFVMVATVAAAFVIGPAAARAAGETVTVQCTPDCTSPTPAWASAPKITFNWTDGEQSLSPDCHDGQEFTPTVEGAYDITCTATYPDSTQASLTVHVRVDHTPPTLVSTPVPTLLPNAADWFNLKPLSVNYVWTDALSGIDATTCDNTVDYQGGDTDATGANVVSDCTDMAGNHAAAPFPIKFDNTPPENVSGTPGRAADHDGWYTHDVTYTFTGDDPQPGSGIASCDTVTYTGPDSATGDVKGGCTDNAGNRTNTDIALKYDGTRPVITGATPDRGADHGDWYNHPVTFAFHGTDTVSGIASCSNLTYSGPDDGTAQVTGKCTDAAGNVTTRSVSFKYDAGAPARSKLYAVPANKSVALNWAPPSDGASFVLKRVPAIGGEAPTIVYRGSQHDYVDTGLRNGTKYNYTLTTLDAAGNSSDTALSSVPDGSTLRPFVDTQVSQPPLLTWNKVRGARYYNLQLYKGRKKVLSVWPRGAKVQLASQWRYQGRKYKLSAGLYRWYVWPGHGRMAAHRYGELVGSSTFRVV